MVNKISEGDIDELRQRFIEAEKNSMMEEAAVQTEKADGIKETEKVQSKKTLETSAMVITEANIMSFKSSNIIFKNNFNILDGLLEEGEIVFFEEVNTNMVEEMNGFNKDTKVVTWRK
ncbi:hypothetical protein MA16_Dca020013 [Dendrobium catenatum]|uniref:Uncharacterized protein n=1 Tax=Dendrobium catenatum TaxID=906689 RepID=A0A2I0WZA0_9ASPA|nr:hypothetical protein MA16_Dca020013 [Dendrobium catenatum]